MSKGRCWEEDHLNDTLCYFPKHRGESWLYVCQEDKDYVHYLLDNVIDPEDNEELVDALRWGVNHVPDRL